MTVFTTRGAALALVLAGTLAGGAAAQTGLGVDTTAFDRSVRPQDDFYQFVNGAWLRNTQIPADRTTYGSFVMLRDSSEEAMRQIVERAAASRGAPGSREQKVGDLYLSFMDTARIEQLGLQPLQADLARIRGVTSKAQLPALFAGLARIGVGYPFGFGVSTDQKQSTQYTVYVSQTGLGLPDRDYYLQANERFQALRDAYVGYMETLLRLAGEQDPAGKARAVLAFETELAQRQWERTRNRDRNATYNRMTLAELRARAPGFDWAAWLREAGVQGVESVVVRQPSYLAGADSVLAATPLETLKAYETVRLLDSAAPFLPRAFAEASFQFRGRTLSGQQEQRPRWKRGVGVVEGALGEVVGEMYVAEHFRPEQKARMERLVANLLEAFRQGIDELEWMTPATRAQAKDKLSKITVKIGYPAKWRDYSALEIVPGDLLGNMRRVAAFEYNRMLSRLGRPVDRTEWGMTPQTVNAYYNATNNEIVFPAAILQPPFFNPDADDAVNYGAIGAVIGHEISHGFDDQGRKSDGEGNLRDWWTGEDASAFEQRATALANQYSQFSPLEGATVNGRLTLGENIGDLSGLAVAYRAYKLSLGGREAPVIGGFTGDQRFFLGWAQVWRSKFRDEALRQQLLTDPHSPGMYRTNGVLVNMQEFYDAFGVKEGDKMYRPANQRVKIW
ncbi:MAG TPA: M13 family metallopeptidase [Longimicrobium sp.]|jgi:predicted metalloendopeptidase